MAPENFSYEELTKFIAVPRETHKKLVDFVGLLQKWQGAINLVSNSTTGDLWNRHILDSIQLVNYIRSDVVIADIGSGAGFPGMVLAIMGLKNITLIESDKRKAMFLEEAARVAGVTVTIEAKRAETIDFDNYNTITARAFAPLSTLFSLFSNGLSKAHRLLLLKGKNYQTELDEARKNWVFDYQIFPSRTDSSGVILAIEQLAKKGVV